MTPSKSLLLVLDFEANCTNNNMRDHEIAEFPVVLIDAATGTSVAEFRSFVKPIKIKKISAFIHGLTGITDEDLRTGAAWAEALKMFGEWCLKNNVNSQTTTVVTCGDWDLKTMFPRQLQISGTHSISDDLHKLFDCWTNVKETYCVVKRYRRAPGMEGMLGDLGLQLVGRHHSGIDDCRNIARICQALIMRYGQDLTLPNRLREVPYHFGGQQWYKRLPGGRIVPNVENKVVFM